MIDALLAKLSVKPLLMAVVALTVYVIGLHGYILLQSSSHRAAMAAVESQRDVATNERNTLQRAFDTMRKANATNVGNVQQLAQALKNQIGREQAVQRALDTASDNLTKARDRAAAYLSQLNAQRDATYATDSTCSAWGNAPVCGAITGSLFDQWEAARNPSGNDGAGGEAGAAAGRHPVVDDQRQPFAVPAAAGSAVWPGLPAARGLLQQPAAGRSAIVRPDLGWGLSGQAARHPTGQ